MENTPASDPLARRIAVRRAELGLSLQQLATKASLTKAHVWELEQDRSTNPTISTLRALARALDWRIRDMIDVG